MWMQSVYKDLPLDGIWIDMNEISGYCTGDVCTDPGSILPPCPSPSVAIFPVQPYLDVQGIIRPVYMYQCDCMLMCGLVLAGRAMG
jgi:hypothetical protein